MNQHFNATVLFEHEHVILHYVLLIAPLWSDVNTGIAGHCFQLTGEHSMPYFPFFSCKRQPLALTVRIERELIIRWVGLRIINRLHETNGVVRETRFEF